jgi:hypothetical protein
MTKPPATALSPYLSLREAVRPAIVAYSLLAREKERAGALIDEAGQLLQATRELLKAAGLVHLLSPEPGREIPGGEGGDRQATLLAAYASAGMQWAKVIGSSLALADSLTDQSRWDDVRRLTACLKDAGEANTAQDLLNRVDEAIRGDYYKRIDRIHSEMSSEEIEDALNAIGDALRDLPDLREGSRAREPRIYRHLVLLAASIVAIDQNRSFSHAAYIADGERLFPDTIEQYLEELSGVFFGRVRPPAKGGHVGA